MSKWQTGTVTDITVWNDRLKSLIIRVPQLEFEAGQFVRVGLEVDGEIIARPYSLVNAPAESQLEILFNIVPEGPLSPKLFDLEVGDDILVANNSTGFLTISEVPDAEQLFMFATGTAVGPFLSILKSAAVWARFKRVILCYSVRNNAEMAYRESIAAIEQAHSDQFSFVPFVTREDHPDALRMRITDAITQGVLEERAATTLSPDNSHAMLCGSADMIRDVSTLLEERGMKRHRRRDPGHFTAEKYH